MKVRKHWLAKHHKQLHHLCSVTNSLSGLIFVKIRAESKRIFSKNPGKIKFCDSVIYLWFRARSDRYFAVWRTCTKSQKSGQNHKHPGDFPQMPGYPGKPGFIRATWSHCHCPLSLSWNNQRTCWIKTSPNELSPKIVLIEALLLLTCRESNLRALLIQN